MSITTEPQTFSVDETFRCLEITFNKASKSEDINQAQKRLMDLDKHILENLKLFLEGIATKDKYSENLKLSALVYIKNSIESKIKRKSIVEAEVWTIIRNFIDFLISSELPDRIINNTNSLLQNLFNLKSISKDPTATIELFKMIGNYLKSQIDANPNDDSSFNIGTFKRLISLMQMLFATKSINDKNNKEIFLLTLDIADMILLKNQNIINNLIASKIPNADVIIPNFEINRQILDLLFLVTIKIKDYENSYEKIETLINRYANTCLHFIMNQSIPNNNLIIYITDNEDLDKVLNSIKAKSFQLISAIIQYSSTDIKNATIIEICYTLIDLIIKNLDYFVSSRILFSLENHEKNLDILFYHIFLFLSRCLNREPILTNFMPFVRKFIVHTLLPFMIATEKEKVNMKTEGEDYQMYIQDIIGDHKSKHSRTSIDFLIVRICDKFDGLASFIVNFCMQMLDFTINSSAVAFDENTQIPEAYDLLSNSGFEFKSILSVFNQESLIDVSIILLCSLKNFIVKNKAIVSKLKTIFDSYINQLHMVGSDLIKFDICLVYDVFLPSFMEDSQLVNTDLEFLNKRLDFLFVCVMNYEKNPGTSAQAAKAITTIFTETNTDNIESKYISSAFSQLISHIENVDIAIFFDVLIEILENCTIEENLIQAITFATKRILKEIKSPNFDDKSNKVIYGKCFNIIKTIIKDNELMHKESIENDVIIPIIGNTLDIEEVEKSLEPLMCYLKNPKKITFEEDLLEILKIILISCKRTTPLAKDLFVHLDKTIDKIGGMDILMYKIMNMYIIKDDGFIFGNEVNMEILVKLLIESLENTEDVDFSPVCGSILLQILPNNKLNAPLPEMLINKVIETMILKINELNQEYVNQYNGMNGTLDMHIMISFLATIYSYFIRYPEVTFKILVGKNFFESFVQLTDLISYFTYFSTQQSKMVILGMCFLLSCDSILAQIDPLLNKILAQLFTLLFRQKNEESKKMKQMLSKEFDCNFVDSDNEEGGENGDDEDEYTPSHLMEYKKAIKHLSSAKEDIYNQLGFFDVSKKYNSIVGNANNPVINFDEYDIFSKIVLKFKSSNYNKFSEWENSLDQNQRGFWNELLHTRRIDLNIEDKATYNVPRRIVKIKRTLDPQQDPSAQ